MAAHGNSRTTWAALESLFSSASGNYELLLVDDASPDDTLDVFLEARKWHSNTRIFSFRSNLEYCESVNAFLSHARGDYLIFISNDIFVCPSYLRRLLDTARAEPAFGIVRGCSNFVDTDQPLHNVSAPEFASRKHLFSFGAGLAWQRRGSAPQDLRFLVGDAFLASRSLIQTIGTFDTRFFGYCADLDFGLRAQMARFRAVLETSAFAYHQRDANLAYLPELEMREKLRRRHDRAGRALALLLQKYGIQMAEVSVHDISFETLAQHDFVPALHYVEPKNYQKFVVP